MKTSAALLLASTLLLSGCATYNQYDGTATGSMLGGMFGSAIGGIMGGPRGSDIGTVVGMVAGGVAGAAASAPKDTERPARTAPKSAPVRKRSGREAVQTHASYQASNIEIANLRFSDANDNRSLDAGEKGFITFDIYNRGRETIYNLTPEVTCDSRHVRISPAATIISLEPGRGIRYRAAVAADRRLKDGGIVISIGCRGENLRNYSISTRR